MRYDTPIFFQRVIQGEYDASTGNYADPIIEETKKYASVMNTGTETVRIIYGELRQDILTIQLQNHYNKVFDRIRVGQKVYGVDYPRKLRTKHIFIPNTLLGVSDAATKEEKKTAYVNYLKSEYEKGNPYNLLHEIKNPEYIPLSQFEQDKLNALTMYAPNTEITNTGGCNMELTYTVDTKSYVDSKILTLSKALL